MKEVGAVIDTLGNVIHWHDPNGSSSGALPDSRPLWDVIWEAHQQKRFAGFAHTHPGDGVPSPSTTDLTTFRAIERALGMRPVWWIASSDRLIALRLVVGEHIYQIEGGTATLSSNYEGHVATTIDWPGETVLAPWVFELRKRSEY